MRAVLQRVSSASVTIAGDRVAAIGPGLLILLGIAPADTAADAHWLAEKICSLRLFEDAAGKMNRSVRDLAGDLLVVSQFTLFADTRKGARPSFNAAAHPDHAIPLYEKFLAHAAVALGRPIASGRFGAMMEVALVNSGPVTLLLDTLTGTPLSEILPSERRG